MPAKLKPLDQQVIVVTGASSGIGLAVARKAAQAGAAVVLIARNEQALRAAADEINRQGGRAHPVVADVGVREEVEKAARAAIARFGGFDTWVNDAGVGIYSELADTPADDHERLFRTNYFGVVHGSIEAVKHLRTRPGGGAIINVGSVLSDIASPLLGAYSASKHAVKGFSDALRIEMQRERSPIAVTLIKPSSVNTPFADHARSYLGKAARVPPPVYAPEVVADAILYAAEHRVRTLTVGAGGRQMVLAAAVAPILADRLSGWAMPPLSTRRGPRSVGDNLYGPGSDGHVRTSNYGGRGFSIYTAARQRPGLVLGVGVLALAAAAVVLNRQSLAAAARPALARTARPIVVKAVRSRPVEIARLAARHPRRAARVISALR